MSDLFVWDFHGTLEKGNEKCVHVIFNRVMKEHGIDKQMPMKEVIELYGKPWAGYFKHFTGSKDEGYIQKLCARAIELSKELAPRYIEPADGAAEILAALKKAGHTNAVMSNTKPSRLKEFVQMVGLTEYFDDYISTDGDKTAQLRKWLDGRRFDRTYVIGDNEEEIEAGIAIGATTILIERDNRKSQANYRVHSLRQIPPLLG